MVEMSIQSCFDRRTFYGRLCEIFTEEQSEMTIARLYTTCQVNFMLKEFHLQTEFLNPNAQDELRLPASSGFRLHHGQQVQKTLAAIS